VLYKTHLTKAIDTTSALSCNREIYRLFREVLQKGIEQGELRGDMSADSLSRHLILAIRGISSEWCIQRPDFSLRDQVIEQFRNTAFQNTALRIEKVNRTNTYHIYEKRL